jgi:hypothetical protein
VLLDCSPRPGIRIHCVIPSTVVGGHVIAKGFWSGFSCFLALA